MIVTRVILSAIAILLSAWLSFRLCYQPYRCNDEIGAAVPLSQLTWKHPGEVRSAVRARGLVAQMRNCLTPYPELVNAYLLIAANLRFMGLQDQALLAYRQALAIDRRPEIYLQIGNTLLEMGHQDQALHYYMLAVTFNPQYIYDRSVLPPSIWNEVYRRYTVDEALYQSGNAQVPRSIE